MESIMLRKIKKKFAHFQNDRYSIEKSYFQQNNAILSCLSCLFWFFQIQPPVTFQKNQEPAEKKFLIIKFI
jgi:hypothetical protein